MCWRVREGGVRRVGRDEGGEGGRYGAGEEVREEEQLREGMELT